MKEEKLIFVYNANGDVFSTVTDFAHKILSPSTYDCHLCALTYGNFAKKQEWKTFIQQFPLKAAFLHKNEFERKYKIPSAYPSVFILNNNELQELVTRLEIDSCVTIKELKNLINRKYNSYVQHHYTNL